MSCFQTCLESVTALSYQPMVTREYLQQDAAVARLHAEANCYCKLWTDTHLMEPVSVLKTFQLISLTTDTI